MNMLMNGLSPVGMIYNQSAENIAYDSNNSVKDKIDTIDFVDGIKYIRGAVSNMPSTVSGTQAQIKYVIDTALNTSNVHTQFDVIIVREGYHKFLGSVYPDKNYGSGIYYDFNGTLVFWKRYNNIDTFFNLNKTVIS